MTILELKDLFENSDATCALYDNTFSDFFWQGKINEIPSSLEIDDMSCSLYDATYETRQTRGVDYEVGCDGVCWEATTIETVKYYVGKAIVTKDCFFDILKREVAAAAKTRFDTDLNKKPPYEIFGKNYQASNILKNCGPTVYNDMLNDCKKSLLKQNKYKLGRTRHIEVNQTTFEVVFKRKEKK